MLNTDQENSVDRSPQTKKIDIARQTSPNEFLKNEGYSVIDPLQHKYFPLKDAYSTYFFATMSDRQSSLFEIYPEKIIILQKDSEYFYRLDIDPHVSLIVQADKNRGPLVGFRIQHILLDNSQDTVDLLQLEAGQDLVHIISLIKTSKGSGFYEAKNAPKRLNQVQDVVYVEFLFTSQDSTGKIDVQGTINSWLHELGHAMTKDLHESPPGDGQERTYQENQRSTNSERLAYAWEINTYRNLVKQFQNSFLSSPSELVNWAEENLTLYDFVQASDLSTGASQGIRKKFRELREKVAERIALEPNLNAETVKTDIIKNEWIDEKIRHDYGKSRLDPKTLSEIRERLSQEYESQKVNFAIFFENSSLNPSEEFDRLVLLKRIDVLWWKENFIRSKGKKLTL